MRLPRKLCALCLLRLTFLLLLTAPMAQGQTASATRDSLRSPDQIAEVETLESRPQLLLQLGHTNRVSTFAFSPDHNYLLTLTEDGGIRLWNIATSQELWRYVGHLNRISFSNIMFSPNSKYVLTAPSGESENEACLRETATGNELRRFSFSRKSFDNQIPFVFSKDSKHLICPSREGLSMLEISTGRETRPFYKGKHIFFSDADAVNFSPLQTYLFGEFFGYCDLWETSTGEELTWFKKYYDVVDSVAFSPDDSYVVVVGRDWTVSVIELPTGNVLCHLRGDFKVKPKVKLSPDGRHLLTGGERVESAGFWASLMGVWNRTVMPVRLWNTNSGEEISWLGKHQLNMACVEFTPDGKHLLGAKDKIGYLWEISTGKEVHRFEGFAAELTYVSSSANGKYILIGGKYSAARIWETETRKEVVYDHKNFLPNPFQFSISGKYFYKNEGDTIYLWETATGKKVGRFGPSFLSPQSLSLSTDGKYLVVAFETSARLLSISTGREVSRLRTEPEILTAIAMTADSKYIITGTKEGSVTLWDASTGKKIRTMEGAVKGFFKGVIGLSVSRNGDAIAAWGDAARVWKTSTGKELPLFSFEDWRIRKRRIIFSGDSKYILAIDDFGGKGFLWDRATEKQVYQFPESIEEAFFAADGRYLLTESSFGEKYRLWELSNTSICKAVPTFQKKEGFGINDWDDFLKSLWREGKYLHVNVKQVFKSPHYGLSPGNKYIFGYFGNHIYLTETSTGRELKLRGHTNDITDIVFLPGDRYFFTSGIDGAVKLWEAETGKEPKELLQLVVFSDELSAVTTPDGGFDTDNIEQIKSLGWTVSDDPLTLLPIEIFMRDYYEPRLLPRVLSGEKLKPIRSLSNLNRVQPGVKILEVEKGASPDIAKVTVEVSAAEKTFQRDGKDVVMKTGVHDLRLYRNGQLVGQWPKAGELTYKSLNTTSEEQLNAWQEATKIPLDESGKATKTFPVRLPRREDLKEVEFTAYAFNLDRVKSETARQTYKVPAKLKSVPGRAYVITVGVSGNEDMGWRLTAPAKDAKLIQKTLVKNLDDTRKYEKVVRVPLITVPPVSDLDDEETKKERKTFINPTKENIKTVIDILAGRKVDPFHLERIPQGLRSELRPVQPEDLVILSFSSHGVTDANGEFYILPYNLGTGSGGRVTPELLKRSISSQELSLWLSTVDAEQMVMVIDACHSGAAVEVEGFKPGPMGNPGLGQLSYDKRMPILAATQAADSAWAKGYSLLTYALVKEGIGERKAAKAGQVRLTDALKYAEERVPKLYEEMMGKEEKRKIQEPKLFDFRKVKIVD